MILYILWHLHEILKAIGTKPTILLSDMSLCDGIPPGGIPKQSLAVSPCFYLQMDLLHHNVLYSLATA